jgi:hypothetical protein
MAATLSDLPVEIFDMIIDYMCAADHKNVSGRWDITNLRLVDRAIESKTKVRFAREGFHTLVLQVPIVWDKRLQYVLRDPIFRNSVRCVAICPGLAQFPLEGGPEEKHAANYVFNSRFRTELRRIMEAHPNVTKVVALSFWLWAYGRSVSNNIAKVEGYWSKVVTEALAALSTMENVRPTKLVLDNSVSQISSFVLRAMLDNPKPVNQLSRLRLLNIIKEAEINFRRPPTSLDETNTFSCYMELAPELRSLQHSTWKGFTHVVATMKSQRLFETFPSVPTITDFTFSGTTINGLALLEGLQTYKETLESLDISKIHLSNLAWSDVFGFLRQCPQLNFFRAANLMEENGRGVSFEVLHRHRPRVLDSSSSTIDWLFQLQFYGPRLPWTGNDRQRNAEVRKLIADDWALVTYSGPRPLWIALDAKEGDDVEAWMAMLETESVLDRQRLLEWD